MQTQNYGINSFVNIVKDSKEFLENFIEEFKFLTLQERKEGMKKLVKQSL